MGSSPNSLNSEGPSSGRSVSPYSKNSTSSATSLSSNRSFYTLKDPSRDSQQHLAIPDSVFSPLDLSFFMIPMNFKVRVPSINQQPNHNLFPTLAFWTAQVKAGLRFPIHPYLCQIATKYHVPLNQFTPAAIRMMISFYILIEGNGGQPTAELFHSQYVLKTLNSFFYVSSRPRSISAFLNTPHNQEKGWKNNYFFLDSQKSWSFPHEQWHYSRPRQSNPRDADCSKLNREIIHRLNSYVEQTRVLFDPSTITNSLGNLHYFKFSAVVAPLTREDEMSWNLRVIRRADSSAVKAPSVSADLNLITNEPLHGVSSIMQLSSPSNQKESDHAEDPSMPHTAKRVKASKGKCGALKNNDVPSMAIEKFGKSSSSKPSKRKADNHLSLQLPDSLLTLKREETLDFLSKLITPKDRQSLHEVELDYEKGRAAGLLIRFSVLFANLMAKMDSTTAENVEDLQCSMKKQAAEISALTNNLADSEEKTKDMLSRIDLLEQELREAKASLAKSEQNFSDLTKYYKTKEDQVKVTSLTNGIELCKRQLFNTAVGQNFLQDLRQGWYDAYRRSSCYLGDMGPYISHFYYYGFDAAVSQQSSATFTGEYDKDGPIDTMPHPPEFPGNLSEPLDHPWWLPITTEVVSTFVTSPNLLSELMINAETGDKGSDGCQDGVSESQG